MQKTTISQNLFNQDESIYQVSLLQSLMLGDYYGSISVGDLKTMGDTGLGTFESMNGEMIVLDRVVYQALSDGSVIIPKDDVMIPFSNITTFNADDSFEINNKMSLENLQKIFDEKVVKNGQNSFYMIKLKGDFPFMKVRSIFSQKVPYRPLMEVIKTD